MNIRTENALLDVLHKLMKLIDLGIKALEDKDRPKGNDGQNR